MAEHRLHRRRYLGMLERPEPLESRRMLSGDADLLAYRSRAAAVLDANVAALRSWGARNAAVAENATTSGISIWTVSAAYARAAEDPSLLPIAEKAAASLMARRTTTLFVGGNDGWEAWATADTYLRHRPLIDSATGRYAPTGLAANAGSVDGRYTLRELFQYVLTKSGYAPIDSTSNHVLMNATARYLAEEAFPGLVEKGYNGSTSDPTGAKTIESQLVKLVTGGPAEYLSLNYGAYNWAEFLSVHQLTTSAANATLARKAKIAFETAFTMNAGYWMNGQLAGPVGRGYPNTGAWGASGGDALTWTFLGGSYGQAAQQAAYAAATDVKALGVLASVSQFGGGAVAAYEIPAALLDLDDPVPKVTRSNFGTNHQYAYNTGTWSTYSESYKWDAFGPYQATWRARTIWTKPERHDYDAVAWVTNPATSLTANANGSWSYVDPYTLRTWDLSGSGTYSGSSVFSDMVQNLNTVLQVYNIPPLAIAGTPGGALPVRGALVYVPVPKVIATGVDAADGDGWFKPVIGADARRLFVAYEGVFMCFLSTAPISLGTRVGQKQFFNIYGGTEPGQQADPASHLQFAVAQETFSSDDFAGTSFAEKFANFQAIMNARELPVLVKADTHHPAWRYADDKATLTSEFGGIIRYADDPQAHTKGIGYDSIGGLGNSDPRIVDYDTWPLFQQTDVGGRVWAAQPQRGNLTVTVPGQAALAYDFRTWRVDTGSDLGLVAAATSASDIRLDWRPVAGASGFTVERSADGATWTTLTTTLPGAATTFTDTGLAQKTSFNYRVTPRGTSLGPSAPAAATTGFRPPTNLRLTLDSTSRITLAWTNVATGNTGVRVEYSLDGSAQWRRLVNLPASHTTRTVSYTDFVGGERLFYRVVAYGTGVNATSLTSMPSNVVGTEFAAAYVGGTTSMPRFLTAERDAARVLLAWQDTATNETGYDVERSVDGGLNWAAVAAGLPANTQAYADASVVAGSPYAYRVIARNGTARSAPAVARVAGTPTNAGPTVAAAASAAAIVFGQSTPVSVLGADDGGEQRLRYAWSVVAGPGVVAFATAPGNAAKSTVATFSRAGAYRLRATITDAEGRAVVSETNVTVAQTPTELAIMPSPEVIAAGGGWSFSAIVRDQFGDLLVPQPVLAWSTTAGSIDATGRLAAPAAAGAAIVACATAGLVATRPVTFSSRPLPLAAYGLDEAAGSVAVDRTGNGFHAALSGGVAFGPGVAVRGAAGGGLVFAGTGVATIGDPAALRITGAITLAAWIRPQSTAGNQLIVGKSYNTGGSAGEIFLRINGGAYQVGSFDGATAMASATIPGGDVGEWVHLLGTFDTDRQRWVLYRNGVEMAISTITTKGAVPVAGRAWTIGATAIGNRFFTGSIDEVEITAASTTAADARRIFDGFQGPTIAVQPGVGAPLGSTRSLTVLGQSPAGEASLVYTWATVGPVPAPVVFPGNGTNAAKAMGAMFAATGSYRIVAAASGGGLTTLSPIITVEVASLTDHVYDVPAGTVQVVSASLAGAARIVKRGGGTLVIRQAGSHSGGSVVEAGALVVAHAGGLGSGSLEIGNAGTVRLAVGYGTVALGGLSLAVGGRLEIGTGRITVAAGGFDDAAVRQGLIAGRNGGGWNGAAGITSRAAPLGSRRAVGARSVGGVLTVGWAAVGDINLDGRVNSIDVSMLNAARRFNAPGTSARWEHGDFNYDGRVNTIDTAMFAATGLFGEPTYRTGPGTVDE